ncbi:polycomb group RING finger protein 6 isoform X3 [Paramormyrops kingsleyae]|uniref:polycomb group RING finger protein 6 isoform X3 n=1 Tax=Paramormyrops kingsleyae TaxID=1676925 RepID=UPI000CD5E55D|nr:polycomb group RING finger protein 6 isoform X2 [Paramormyrops kingsleyae]
MEAKDEQILRGDPPESPSGVTGKDTAGEAMDLEAEAGDPEAEEVEAGVEGFPRPCTSWERRAGPSSSEESQAFGSNDETDEHSFPLAELFPYICCTICKGFFIEATTITECLHTFCKSCIVKHFFYSNRCPNCNVVVHQTQPLYNIRLDRQLQDIVFKMIPHLEERERERMQSFYKERGLEVPKPVGPSPVASAKAPKQKKSPLAQSGFTIPSELDVSLVLEFVGAEEGIDNYKPLERKYVRVSGEATIHHVELFIRRKMELNPACQVDVVCGDHLLDRYQSLREVQNVMGEGALQQFPVKGRQKRGLQSAPLHGLAWRTDSLMDSAFDHSLYLAFSKQAHSFFSY